ncbi:MAG: winged helix-turn-helix domain-containing protein [Methanothrix sp.]|nr:winged helix-turn-helix domain-containing protein [Methanothrix sp.]MDD4448812.1 winged helix-turn-helix domain-containing protein [Methanothrix sp.]
MTQTTVESLFGTKAGVVWRALNQYGPSNITHLVKTASLSREEVFCALGWLGREDKIVMEQKGREMIFSLRESKASLQAPPKMIEEDLAPKAKSKRSKGKPPKKAKKTQTVKAPARQDESQAKESERTRDFLLH